MINLYEILGIKKSADKATIKKAYRKLSKIHHPDVGGNSKQFGLINKAYKILIDDNKKARYDNGESVDNIIQGTNNIATSLIMEIFVKLMQSFNPETQDIIKQIDKSIDLNIQKASESILAIKSNIEKYKIFLKKLKCKNKKKSLLFQVANVQISQKKQTLKIQEKRLVDCEKAKKLIKDYDYNIVEEMMININISTNAWG